jgi:hypothetical protein
VVVVAAAAKQAVAAAAAGLELETREEEEGSRAEEGAWDGSEAELVSATLLSAALLPRDAAPGVLAVPISARPFASPQCVRAPRCARAWSAAACPCP